MFLVRRTWRDGKMIPLQFPEHSSLIWTERQIDRERGGEKEREKEREGERERGTKGEEKWG